MIERLKALEKFMDAEEQDLTHFFVQTRVGKSAISGLARICIEPIANGQLIAILGGILLDVPDGQLAMPLGFGLYLHQVSDRRKATVNHSCDPNCKIDGLNKLMSRRAINPGEELTIDYGTVSVGKGTVIIDDCQCGTAACRHHIKTDDYLRLSLVDLAAHAKHTRRLAEGI